MGVPTGRDRLLWDPRVLAHDCERMINEAFDVDPANGKPEQDGGLLGGPAFWGIGVLSQDFDGHGWPGSEVAQPLRGTAFEVGDRGRVDFVLSPCHC